MTRECNLQKNIRNCSCTYTSCSRRGVCCECIAYHNRMGELPGCLFPPEVERTYNRSRSNYINSWTK